RGIVCRQLLHADRPEVLQMAATDGSEADDGEFHWSPLREVMGTLTAPTGEPCRLFQSASYSAMCRTSRSTMSSRSPYSSTALNFLQMTAVTRVASPRSRMKASRSPPY